MSSRASWSRSVIGSGSGFQRPDVGDALMRAMSVVELLVLPQRMQQMPLVPDQRAVQHLEAAGPYPAFHDRVHAEHLDTAEHDLDAGVGEDRVEHGWILAVPVPDQVLDFAARVLEILHEVACGLADPGGG